MAAWGPGLLTRCSTQVATPPRQAPAPAAISRHQLASAAAWILLGQGPMMRRALILSLLAVVATVGACTDVVATADGPDGGVSPAGDPGNDDPDSEDPGDDESPAPDPVEPAATQSAATLSSGCTARGTLAGHPVWMFFTRPDRPCTGKAGSGKDRHALVELTRLINSVPAGGRIDGHIFSISVDSVAKALLDAQTRGVSVWLSTDGQVKSSKDYSNTRYLSRIAHLVYCTSSTNRACIGTAKDAISHTKLFAFSTATAPDGAQAHDVVWFGSANQTYASGEKLYNNTVTIYGASTLYGELRGYLDDLYHRRRTSDYYVPSTGRGHLLAGAADVYVSPELSTDLVVHRLDDVTPTSSCRVRVMQAEILDSRMEVADQLVKMKRGGCKVWVALHKIGSRALATLHAAHIPVHQMPIHDKAFLVYGKVGGSYAYHVYTGSQNMSFSAAHRYDEIFVKLAAEKGSSHPIYSAFYSHFNDAYNAGKAL